MSDNFVIRFLPGEVIAEPGTETFANAEWLLVDATGGRMGMVLSGSLAEAAPLAVGRKVIAIVPGTEASFAEPVLPPKRAAQLETLARYALEEQLASDIDDLHFALSKRSATGAVPVVAVQDSRMQAWLSQLAAVGLHADAMYVDSDLVPNSSGIVLVVQNGFVWVRHGASRATVLDVRPISSAFDVALPIASNSSQESAPDIVAGDVTIYVGQADHDAYSNEIESLSARVPNAHIKLLPEGPLPLFALEAARPSVLQNAPVNLLTGKYARKRAWDKTLAPWRVAAMLCGVAVLIYLATSSLRVWQLVSEEKELDRQIVEVLTQTLPAVSSKDPRNARRQFESQLATVRGGGDNGGLLHGLRVLGNTVEQVPDTRIDALAYRTKVIDIRVTAPSVDALDRIQHLVTEQGINAEIQSATPRDNKVEGRLQLKSPEA
jgi:general secretion pathway protein L